MPTILVLENNEHLAGVLHGALSAHEYNIVKMQPSKSALEFISAGTPDLILLDINLREADALGMCRTIRRSSAVPMVVVSERGSPQECVSVLDLGADDYLVQPLDEKELLARIRAHMRHSQRDEELSVFSAAGITVDFARMLVTVRGRQIHLPPKQFRILKYLISRKGKPVPSRELCEVIWGMSPVEHAENLRVLISQLRKVLESDPEHPRYILTEPRVGYRFDPSPEGTLVPPQGGNPKESKSRSMG
jgi:two-component system, OmpR family, KDP operon response regulator KdpE